MNRSERNTLEHGKRLAGLCQQMRAAFDDAAKAPSPALRCCAVNRARSIAPLMAEGLAELTGEPMVKEVPPATVPATSDSSDMEAEQIPRIRVYRVHDNGYHLPVCHGAED